MDSNLLSVLQVSKADVRTTLLLLYYITLDLSFVGKRMIAAPQLSMPTGKEAHLFSHIFPRDHKNFEFHRPAKTLG
jgi:hypothetical protein